MPPLLPKFPHFLTKTPPPFYYQNGTFNHFVLLKRRYRSAQTENAKSMSYQGLSQRGINEKSVCIRGRSAKQHGHDR